MNIFLLLALIIQREPTDNFLKETTPHLSYLICGPVIISNSKTLNFGVEGNFSDYKIPPYDVSTKTPSLNGYTLTNLFKQSSLKFYPYLKIGFYPKSGQTNKTAPFLSLGFNLIPKFSNFIIFRFSYSTLSPIEYYPGDPYYNFQYQSFNTFDFSLMGLKKISVFTPFITAGLMPSYVTGLYRRDASEDFGFPFKFNKIIVGWHVGVGFKIFFVKLDAGLVNGRLSASTSFNL
jgi:hypothetical protein